jgi:hypothetical protein
VAIGIVQAVRVTGSNTATIAATGAGNTLFVAYAGSSGSNAGGNPSVTGVTLGGSGTGWAVQADQRDTEANSASCSEIWMCNEIAGGKTSVVVSGTNLVAADAYMLVVEVSGLSNAQLDRSSTGPIAAGTNTWTSNATTQTTSQNEFWIGVTAHGPNAAGDTLTGPASPWTNATGFTWAGGSAIAGYQIVAAEAAATYSGTSVDFDYYTCVVATFVAGAYTTGASALSGSGTISEEVTLPEFSILSGSGSLHAAVSFPETGIVLSGSGSITALASGTLQTGLVALVGSGAITATPTLKLPVTASLSGSGTITPRVYLYASLSGSGTLTAGTYIVGRLGLIGSGSIVLQVVIGRIDTLSGSGSLVALQTIGGTFVWHVINSVGNAWEQTVPYQIVLL